jgi:hypothetical protein
MSAPSERPGTSPKEILGRARAAWRGLDSDASPFGVEMLGFTVGRSATRSESRVVFAVMQLVDLVPPGRNGARGGADALARDVLTVLDLRRVAGGAPRARPGASSLAGDGEFGVLATSSTDSFPSIDALHPLPASRHLEIPVSSPA